MVLSTWESRKWSIAAVCHTAGWEHPPNSSESPSLCQHCGDVQAIFGALPQLSLQPPTYWQASALWLGNQHQTWRGCGVAEPNRNAAQTDGGRGLMEGGWVWKKQEVWLCQHLWVHIYGQEYGNPAKRYGNLMSVRAQNSQQIYLTCFGISQTRMDI